MEDVLSQNQIDALLNSISDGADLPADTSVGDHIKKYDFYSPKKFTKEQLRTIDSMHENMSRLLASYFSGILRVFADVSVLQVEEQWYYEYNNALSDVALIGLVDMQSPSINLPDSTLMLVMSNNISFFLIDRLLGGQGEDSMYSRDFTDVELAIMRNIYVKITEFMVESWRAHIDISGELTSIETNPRLLQIYAPEDIVVIAALNVKLGNTEGTLSVCIPAIGLESYLGEFTSKYARISHKTTNEKLESVRQASIQESLSETDLTVKAIFDETSINISDALTLQPNDIITLSKPLNGVVKVEVDNTPWFHAQLGSSRNKKAVKIIDSINEGSKNSDL